MLNKIKGKFITANLTSHLNHLQSTEHGHFKEANNGQVAKGSNLGLSKAEEKRIIFLLSGEVINILENDSSTFV